MGVAQKQHLEQLYGGVVSLKEKVYRLLLEGYCATQIANKLQKNKGYISRIIKRLEKAGYIVQINPNEIPKFYIATKKTFNRDKLLPVTPVKKERCSHRLEIVEIQKSTFISQIKVQPTKAKWDKHYVWRPGVEVFQFSYPFKDFGIVRFRRFKSKTKDKLMIILPRIMVNKDDVDNVENILSEYALMLAGWIKKKFDMPLSKPEICQKPHYAVPCREPEIIHALEKRSFKIGEMMADTSPPDCIPEIESTDGRDVVNYLEGINKIKYLEEKLLNNKSLLNKMMDTLEIVVDNQTSIVNVLNNAFSDQNSQSKLKDDSFIDVT